MSKKGEKYARYVERCMERGLSNLEEHLKRLETAQADQGDLIQVVLEERTAAEEFSKRRLLGMMRRAAEAERKADLWKAVALGAVLAVMVLCLAAILSAPMTGTAAAEEDAAPMQAAVETAPATPALVLSDVVPPAEPEPARVHVIQDCVVSYYCCERYAHICGTGDGITATGTEARPWVTCSVDPTIIPLGSTVTVDFGNGETVECVAEDVGVWVQGEHVDICVSGHQEALELGIRRADVSWEAPT